GNYRLALTGFGSAMEAMLIDFLIGQNTTALQTAVSAALSDPDAARKARFTRYETQTDPKTWRFVNLINVEKKVRIAGTYPEPSHALRDWRNLVHPAVAMQQFVDQSKL